jgi:hypothetical protein
MSDPKRKPAEEAVLPIERVERVGDYFKRLFVRSLRLDLDDDLLEHPWKEARVPVDPSSVAADDDADALNARQPGEKAEDEHA